MATGLIVLALALTVSQPPARAQDAENVPSIANLPPLARVVPKDVGLFVEIDGLLDIGLVFRDQNVWQWVQALLGGVADRRGWPDALAASLGIESSEALLRFFRERVALAAPDWTRLSQGVIVFTSANPRVLDEVLQRPGTRRVGNTGRVALYQSRGGTWLAHRGSTIVLARVRGRGAIFERCVNLLNNDGKDSLAFAEPFRACLTDLEGPRLVWAYWALKPTADQARPALTNWWPALRHGALAIQQQGQDWVVTLRGAPQPDEEPAYQPRVLLDRIGVLPQLSLGVWATTIDARELFTAAREFQWPESYADLGGLLAEVNDPGAFESEVISRIGPRCMVLFGANFRSPSLDPQVALLIESVDAPAVVTALRENVEQLAQSLMERSGEAPFTLTQEDYVGVAIHAVNWPKREGEPNGDTLASLIVSGMHPAAAAVDGWVVLSTSVDQVHEIIDARNGMTQRLADVLAHRQAELSQSGSIAVLQPMLVQSIVRYWHALLSERQQVRRGSARLGINVQTEPLPGAVLVDAVDSNGPAAALLAPGDTIFACNGELLAMDGALPHLRKLVSTAPGGQDLTLRALRDGRIIEIAVPLGPDEPAPPPRGLSAVVAQLAPVESLAESVNLAVLAVDRPSDRGYRAQITLQMAPRSKPPTAAAPPTEIPPE